MSLASFIPSLLAGSGQVLITHDSGVRSDGPTSIPSAF